MLEYGSVKRILVMAACFIMVVFVARSVAVQKIIVGNGFSISLEELRLLAKGMPEEERQILLSDELKLNKYLRFLAQVEAFYVEAKRLGLDKDPILQAEIELCKKKILALAALKREVDEKMEKFKLSDSDLRLYYETHKDKFVDGGKILPFDKVKWIIRDMLVKKRREEVTKQVIEETLEDMQVRILPFDKKRVFSE